MTMGKRQLVLAALIVALGAAVYLNWQFTGNNQLLATNAVTSTSDRTLGEAQFVDESQASGASKASSSTSSIAVQTSVNADTYFTQAQLSRQKARDSAVELAEKVIADAKSSDVAKRKQLFRRQQLQTIKSKKPILKL